MKEIKVLGSGCVKCRNLYRMVEVTAGELAIDIDLKKVEDINEIIDHGVMLTPALIVDGEVQFSGKLPSPEQLKKILQQPSLEA